MATIEADCGRIAANAAAVVALCGAHGIDVAGVTKAVCGEPAVARAMLAGGCTMLADSRLENVARLRDAGIGAPVMLLRQPARSEADDAVRLCDLTLVSEIATARALSAAALAQRTTHEVVLMVECGDRREGVMEGQAGEACRQVLDLPALTLAGLGSVLGCLCGVVPTIQSRERFAALARRLEQELDVGFRLVSAGNTDHLPLVAAGTLPSRIDQLRVGEGILSGTVEYEVHPTVPLPHQDAFTVKAPVVELMDKPSAPEGPVSLDAFGRAHDWPDLGPRRRALVALGEIDLRIEGLRPRQTGVTLVGASSDVLIVDVTDASPPVRLWEELAFEADYMAVATGWASSLTRKKVTTPMETATEMVAESVKEQAAPVDR